MGTEDDCGTGNGKNTQPGKVNGDPHLEKRIRNARRETEQFDCLKAILERETFSTACVVLRFYGQAGHDPQQLAFAVKGFLRTALGSQPDGGKLKRFMGTQKKHWVKKGAKPWIGDDAASADLLSRWKDIGPLKEDGSGEIDLPLGWRSRVLFRTFFGRGALIEFLNTCPLSQWNQKPRCPLMDVCAADEGDSDPYVLLQIHDVEWMPGRKLSELLVDYARKNWLAPFQYVADHSCHAVSSPSPVGESATNRPGFPLRIVWRLDSLSALHSRCSRQFALEYDHELAEEIRAGAKPKTSHHLRLRRTPCDFGQEQPSPPPSVMVSSIKGVLRSATAWLLESLGRNGTTQGCSVTSEYSMSGRREAQKAGGTCPVQLLLGGLGQDGKGGLRSPVRVFARRVLDSNPHSSFFACKGQEHWKTKPLLFSWQFQHSKPGELLKMETSELTDAFLVTEIQPGIHAHYALLAVCLAMDLISTGFFRIGGFSTRGYGVIRCVPHALENLQDWAVSLTTGVLPAARDLSALKTGFELALDMGFTNPLGELASWLKNVTKPEQ